MQQNMEESFQTVRILKEDAEARISLVRHPASGQRFVLRDFSGDPSVYRKLMKITSPHLPRIYEVTDMEGRLLVLEEFIEGDSLYAILQHGLFDGKQTRDISRQLCQALWVLHSLGAVHRDVKPENILLRGNEAVLIDFNASRIRKKEKNSDTKVLGTTGYAAPEQYGIAQTDGRADIYALGVVMNIMMTGEHPSVKLAPGRMGRIIRRCTMMNPKQRYQNVKRLLETL